MVCTQYTILIYHFPKHYSKLKFKINKNSRRHYSSSSSRRGILLEKCKLCFHLKFLQNIGIEMLLYFFNFVMRFFSANHDYPVYPSSSSYALSSPPSSPSTTATESMKKIKNKSILSLPQQSYYWCIKIIICQSHY